MVRRLQPFRLAVLSVVKHDYIARALIAHPDFVPVVIADEAQQPAWIHERNLAFAREFNLPYVCDIQRACTDYQAQVAVVSPEAERHIAFSLRAVELGLHVVQDKPMSPRLADCDRLVELVEQQNVRFLMWNRNTMPAILQASETVRAGGIGDLVAIHMDFYFAKDAGPPLGSRAPNDPPMDWLTALRDAHATGADGGVGHIPMGELQVEGIYPLAYLKMLTDAQVIRVFAHTSTHFHQLHADNHVDDLATLTLGLENGIAASLVLGRIGNASHPDLGEIKLHLLGTEGALDIREPLPEVALDYRGRGPEVFRHERISNHYAWRLAENVSRAIDGQSTTLLDVRESRQITAIVEAALRSARERRVIELSEV